MVFISKSVYRENISIGRLQPEQSCALGDSIRRTGHSVTDNPRVGENFVVIATNEGFIAEEMNLVVLGVTNETKAVGLIPPFREDIEGDLSANRKSQLEMSEFLGQRCDHINANVVFLVL